MSAPLPGDGNRELRPERLITVAEHLDEAIGEFRAWGVRIPDNTRLPAISRLLRATASAGAYPEDHSQLTILGDAIRTAQEFIEIANALPVDPIESVRHDLQHAVKGDLSNSEVPGPNLRFQTQLWVGSMLGSPGTPVGVYSRAPEGKSPDFILPNGTLKYAVEVKRPNGRLNAQDVIRTAYRQIREADVHGGVIVIDVTDCIDAGVRYQYGCGDGRPSGVAEAMEALLSDLHTEVFIENRSSIRRGREHVFSLISFCRAMYWDVCRPEYPVLSRYVATVNYWRRDHRTLRAHRARWLGDLIHQGIMGAGHQQLGSVDTLLRGER